KIAETLKLGRRGQMPALGAAVGTSDDVKNVANYVLSLSGGSHDSVRAQLGKAKFGVCAACHGIDGKGNQALGAPNLADDIWLHGWGEKAIIEMINNGKLNEMPAQTGLLTEPQIHVLTGYIWGLSNKAAPAKP
ncbi:MAG: c-type cytochrome, partial [Burkholderiaceae bacterium]|nr:c-type cytochrome [Burkholderiaceae bacterium]